MGFRNKLDNWTNAVPEARSLQASMPAIDDLVLVVDDWVLGVSMLSACWIQTRTSAILVAVEHYRPRVKIALLRRMQMRRTKHER